MTVGRGHGIASVGGEAPALASKSAGMVLVSGVAAGGGRPPRVSPFYDTNQTKKKTALRLASLEMFSILEWTKK